jgi:general secretion pathway protein A
MYEDYFGLSTLPFSITPDPRFFYDNPVYREAFATLRYGIESRKGFVLITGEVGTGKTTLLKVFMQGAESTIHTAFIFNPKLSPSELLRVTLNDLGVATSTEDRVALMAQLNNYLIEQLKKRQVVALLVDEAQNVSDDLLEELRLLSNLETNRDKLIQIVLMGQPELEQRLDKPELRQLKQRVALRYRLAPLKNHEVYFYIESRLKTAGYEGKGIFDPEAVEKITLYSKGIPRLINVICDNALLIAYAGSRKTVSEEVIEEVARDLQLTWPSAIQYVAPPTDFDRPKNRPELTEQDERDEATIIKESEPSAWVSRRQVPEFQEFSTRPEESPLYIRRQRSSLPGVGIGFLLGSLLTAGIGVLFYPESNRAYISAVAGHIEQRAKRQWESVKPANLEPGVLKEDAADELQSARVLARGTPPTAEQQPADQNVEQDITSLSDPNKPAESPAAITPERTPPKQTAINDKRSREKARVARGPGGYSGADSAAANDRLEFEIYKAIANRAIQGVQVSVTDGTVYLGGRVATERQKIAAAQAARSVPGVKSIRDQIAVNYGTVASRYTEARPTPTFNR